MATPERFSLRGTYLYLVCLISLVIAIFALVNTVNSIVELLYPDPGFYGGPIDGKINAVDQARSEAAARQSAHRQSVLGLIAAGTTLLIAIPVYAYHWHRVQVERREPAELKTASAPSGPADSPVPGSSAGAPTPST